MMKNRTVVQKMDNENLETKSAIFVATGIVEETSETWIAKGWGIYIKHIFSRRSVKAQKDS
jgi:hypothetical protein